MPLKLLPDEQLGLSALSQCVPDPRVSSARGDVGVTAGILYHLFVPDAPHKSCVEREDSPLQPRMPAHLRMHPHTAEGQCRVENAALSSGRVSGLEGRANLRPLPRRRHTPRGSGQGGYGIAAFQGGAIC